MSVYLREWKSPTGAKKQAWMVQVFFTHADGRIQEVRRKSPVQTRRGAEQYERDVRAALLNGTYGKEAQAPVPTLAEFVEEFMTSYAINNNKLSEVDAKKGHFKNHLLPALGDKRLDKISPREVELYKSAKRSGKKQLNKKTINNHLSSLRKLLNVAAEWSIIAQVPKVKPFSNEPSKFDFLDFTDAERLIKGAESERWRAMVLVALNTGMRLGELMGLHWEDVDLVRGVIRVNHNLVKGRLGTPKNGKNREIPLNSRAVTALKAHRHQRGDYVFCQDDGAPLTQQICRKALMRVCKRAELRHIQWHGMRHTFASHLVMRGVALKAVQELLGHATIAMTMRYSHLTPDIRKDAVEALVSVETPPEQYKSSTRDEGVENPEPS